VLGGSGIKVIPGGGNSERLGGTLAKLATGADGIISFGMAGALDPSLAIGDWVIGERLTGSFDAECDERWAAALAQSIPTARLGPIHADGRLIADPAEKYALAMTRALAADMESHIAARAAAQAGLPFAVLRCISDTAGHALPPAIGVAMRADGGLALGAIIKSIIKYPAQIPDLMRTFSGFNRAYAALGRGAQATGPRLAFDLR